MRTTDHTAKAGHAVVVVCVSLLILVLSACPALAHRGRVFGPSFGAPGSGAGQLSLTSFHSVTTTGPIIGGSGLAADEVTHNVYVADTGNHRVDEFTSTGVFVRAWGWGVQNGASEFQICTKATGCRAGLTGTSPGEFESPAFVAVDDSPGGEGDVYVADYRQGDQGSLAESGDRLVQKFTAQGVLIESWGSKGQIHDEGEGSSHLGPINGVAVVPSGELLVGSGKGALEFTQSSGTYLETFMGPDEFPNGFSVDGSGNYYGQIGHQIVRFSPTGALDDEIFEVPQPSSQSFTFVAPGLAVSRSGELYVDEGNAIQVIASSCASHCAPATTFTSPLLTDGAGLAVDSGRETVYIAEIAAEKIQSIVPEPPAAPLVEKGSQTVSNVSAESATLEAAINPRSETSEEPTTYHFQYTTEERFQREGFNGADSIPVPDGQVSPSFEADLVAAHLQGLAPDAVYHFRLFAENAISRKDGHATEGERTDAGEEVVRTFTTQAPGVFSLPDGRAWELVSPPDKHGALLGFYYGGGVIQAAAGGDAITYLASLPTESEAPGNSNQTQVLSTRGAAGALSWGSRDISTPREVANGLKEAGSEEYKFFSADLSLSIVNPFGPFDPSLSPEASEQRAFLRTDFSHGDPTDTCSRSCYRPLVTGAPGVANVPKGTIFGRSAPQFVGATPDASHVVLTSTAALAEGAPNESLYEWVDGQLQLVSVLDDNEPSLTESFLGRGDSGEEAGVGRNAISTDGSRIVWSTRDSQALYLRDTVREETVQLGSKGAEFQTASSDDTRVFFTVAGDLYVFEAPAGQALSAGHTANLTPVGGVLGLVPGVSQGGSTVYFVGQSVMTGETNEQDETAVAGQPNLYVENGGATRLVAVLSSADQRDWSASQSGDGVELQDLTSRVSQNGRWLAFMSQRSLTGYGNRDALSGERDEEVFLYDATANNGQGKLICASCDPTGARPHGIFSRNENATLVDAREAWVHTWIAGNVPGWVSPIYQSRYLSDAGRLFFDSADTLVPSDTNGTEDVYEYEPPGVGGCTGESANFSARSGGCVDLISSGVAKEESAFLDASESGDDVFFLTSAQLSSTDRDSVPDVYDARVNGGFPEPQAFPACEGDACQSPVAAPNDPTPGSLTYRGPGNPVPLLAVSQTTKKKVLKCTHGRKLKHGKCVKTKSKRAKKEARRARSTKMTRKTGEKGRAIS